MFVVSKVACIACIKEYNAAINILISFMGNGSWTAVARLLVFAALFVFTLEGGIGCERLSKFFHLLRLQRHIAVSPTALRTLRVRWNPILEYQHSNKLNL
jgi:hypothetical protein